MRAFTTFACLILIFFFENCCRYLIGIARIPFLNYESFAFSTIAGVAFTALNSIFGVILSLMSPKNASTMSLFSILSASTFIYSVLFLATAYLSTVLQVVLIRVAMGAMLSIVTPYSVAIIDKSFSRAVSGRMLGMYYSASYCAFAFSMGVGTDMYTAYGWKAAYLIFGPIGVAIALISLLVSYCLTYGPCRETNSSNLQGYGTVSLESQHGESVIVNPITSARTAEEEARTTESTESAEIGINTYNAVPTRTQSRICQIVYHWWCHSYVYTIVLATGVRLGAGYVWSNYSSLFFSPLFHSEGTAVGHACRYSYNSGLVVTGDLQGVCTAAFPYCVHSTCSALTATPWHNKVLRVRYFIYLHYYIPLARTHAIICCQRWQR